MLITNHHNHTACFKLINPPAFPLSLAPGEEHAFSVQFGPAPSGDYQDVLSFYEDIENDSVVQRISCQVGLTGTISNNSGLTSHNKKILTVSPNPGTGIFQIRLADEHTRTRLIIIKPNGIILESFDLIHTVETRLNMNKYPDGYYCIQAKQSGNPEPQTVKIIKTSNSH